MSSDPNTKWPHIGLIPLCPSQVNNIVATLGAGISRYIGYFERSSIISITKRSQLNRQNLFNHTLRLIIFDLYAYKIFC